MLKSYDFLENTHSVFQHNFVLNFFLVAKDLNTVLGNSNKKLEKSVSLEKRATDAYIGLFAIELFGSTTIQHLERMQDGLYQLLKTSYLQALMLQPTVTMFFERKENCSFGPWEIVSRKGPILRTEEADR